MIKDVTWEKADVSPVPEKYSAKYLDVSVPLQCEMCFDWE